MDILFFTMHRSSFTDKDLKIIQSKYRTKNYPAEKLFSIELFKEIKKTKLLFFWFSSLNFLLPVLIGRMLGKKIVVVAGGYDVANVPELHYGSFNSPVKRFLTLLMLKSADKIICVSQSNCNELFKEYPYADSKTKLIYHGFDAVKAETHGNKKDSVLTTGLIDNVSYLRKGFDRFLSLAAAMPLTEFHHIGKIDPSIKLPQYSNIKFHGFLPADEYAEIMSSAKVYLQLSRHEGFGCSVAEAMQYGCIPVVSNSYALPEVTADCGVIIDNPDDNENLTRQIERIFRDYNSDKAAKCKGRVEMKFSLNDREAKLIEAIDSVLN